MQNFEGVSFVNRNNKLQLQTRKPAMLKGKETSTMYDG